MKQVVREAVLYTSASGAAMVADVSLLWLLVEKAHFYYLVAATIAFLAGTIIVYTISVRLVFDYRRIQDRRREFSVFAAIGVVGLFVNLIVLKIAVDGLGAHYLLGKIASIFFTFSLNFGLRRTLLFTAESGCARGLNSKGPTG